MQWRLTNRCTFIKEKKSIRLLTENLQESNELGLTSQGIITPNNLFRNHNLLSSHDPRKARHSVETVFCPHLLRVSGKPSDLNFIHRGANLASLSFNYISYGADVEVSVNDIDRSHYIVVIPLTGFALVTNRKRGYDLLPGSLVILDPFDPFKFEMQPDHSHLAVGIPRQRLKAYLNKCTQNLTRHFEYQARPYRPDEIGDSLISFISYICGEMDRPGSMTQENAVSQSIEHAFLTLFDATLGERHNNSVVRGIDLSSTCHYVYQAESFMEHNLTEEISADDIIDAVGIPARTLYHAYKKQYNVGPMTWLRLRRLRQARLDLLAPENADTSITEIALRYQQSHLGRFSKAYTKEFGERPSDTRKHLKLIR